MNPELLSPDERRQRAYEKLSDLLGPAVPEIERRALLDLHLYTLVQITLRLIEDPMAAQRPSDPLYREGLDAFLHPCNCNCGTNHPDLDICLHLLPGYGQVAPLTTTTVVGTASLPIEMCSACAEAFSRKGRA